MRLEDCNLPSAAKLVAIVAGRIRTRNVRVEQFLGLQQFAFFRRIGRRSIVRMRLRIRPDDIFHVGEAQRAVHVWLGRKRGSKEIVVVRLPSSLDPLPLK
jgi:hypothetical protein